jgi:arylsulfatase A-like enzyme
MVKVNKSMNKNIVSFFIIIILIQACSGNTHDEFVLEKANNNKPLNIVFILSDDHRYDFMGFTGKVPFLQTPNMDKMALQGAHIQNAFVTTSLCSPSRASILTGQYAHHHGVVDNQSPIADSVNFFPQYLQRAGYETAFVGKWHMGHDNDEPRKGFDRWVSFRGQGNYYNPAMNVDGEIYLQIMQLTGLKQEPQNNLSSCTSHTKRFIRNFTLPKGIMESIRGNRFNIR